MTTLAETLEVREKVLELELRLPRGFKRCPINTLAKVYNGLGPDRFPEWLRRVITWLLAIFRPAAMPHDYRYTYGEKSYWAFAVANIQLAIDCMMVAMDMRSVRRMLLDAALGLFLALLCQMFGYSGYKQGTPPDAWRPEGTVK